METFDIEAYLNSLPENILEIDISLKSITYIPNNIIRFRYLQRLNCGHNNLTCLPILPKSLKTLICANNQLTCLPVLPEPLKELYCYNNQLTCLPVLAVSLQILSCGNNQLTCLPILPESLQLLSCINNRCTYLPVLSESLQLLWCDNNQLTCFPVLPESLKILNCRFNPIYNILNTHNLTIIKYKINVLNKFRFVYYCIRLKKRFMGYYLWSKRKNYLMFSEGTHIINEDEYTHNYILNEYVGRDIMSYI